MLYLKKMEMVGGYMQDIQVNGCPCGGRRVKYFLNWGFRLTFEMNNDERKDFR